MEKLNWIYFVNSLIKQSAGPDTQFYGAVQGVFAAVPGAGQNGERPYHSVLGML